MKGLSPSTKGKASRVRALRPYHIRVSSLQRVRRSQVGAKLAYYSSSDGSPERPVKVVVVGGDAGCDGDGSHVRVPVFGGGDRVPTSSDKIGESSPSSASVPKMGAGGGRPNEPGKLEACSGGMLKEAMKLVAGGSGGNPERVVNIGHSRLRFDNLGQPYVLDSEDEGSNMEEAGGNRGVRRHSAACSRLAAACAASYKHGRAVVPNVAVETATIADPALEVAMAVGAPMGDAVALDELRPELKVLLDGMDPILHDTYLAFLKNFLPARLKP